MTRSRI
jgi:hypothetical protein